MSIVSFPKKSTPQRKRQQSKNLKTVMVEHGAPRDWTLPIAKAVVALERAVEAHHGARYHRDGDWGPEPDFDVLRGEVRAAEKHLSTAIGNLVRRVAIAVKNGEAAPAA